MQSTYLKNADANWIKGTTYPSAPTLYLSLHSTDPSVSGANEITLFTSRFTVATTSSISTVGTSREISIAEITSFLNASAGGTATHFGVWDAATTGNFLGGGELLDEDGIAAPIAFLTGEDVVIPANALKISYQRGVFTDYFIDAKLNWFKGTTFPAAPANTYTNIGLNLQSDGTGTEATLTRQMLAWSANTTAGDNIRLTNTANVNFGAAISENTVNSAGFYDALTTGNLLWVTSYPERTFAIGDSMLWEAGRIAVDF